MQLIVGQVITGYLQIKPGSVIFPEANKINIFEIA